MRNFVWSLNLFIGLTIVSGLAHASVDFPFADLLKQQSISVCGELAAGESNRGLDVQHRQNRFNKLYGPGVFADSDPDFVPFLVFIDAVSGEDRRAHVLQALNKVSEGEAADAIAALKELDSDTQLISKYFRVLQGRLPKMSEAFEDAIEFTEEMAVRWRKNIIKISELKFPVGSPERAEFVKKLVESVDGARTKLEGYYTEFQLSLRTQNVESAGFYLGELLAGQKMDKVLLKQKIQFLVDPRNGVADLVAQVEDDLVKVDLNDPFSDTILEAKAHMLLTKEFDLRSRTGPHSETWYEPKNYDRVFASNEFSRPKGKSLRKQVKVGFIVRKIMKKLYPDLSIRFEFHFLNGIEPKAKAKFEKLFVDLQEADAVVIGEVE